MKTLPLLWLACHNAVLYMLDCSIREPRDLDAGHHSKSDCIHGAVYFVGGVFCRWCTLWVVYFVGCVFCGWCILWVVYFMGGVFYGWYILWVVYFVGGVFCGWCILWVVYFVGGTVINSSIIIKWISIHLTAHSMEKTSYRCNSKIV